MLCFQAGFFNELKNIVKTINLVLAQRDDLNILIIDDTNRYKNRLLYFLITFCFFVILSLLKNEGIVMVTILLSIMIIINISKKEMLQNYKKIIFLLFSLIPILIWKITCINYNVENDIINYNNLNSLKNMIFNLDLLRNVFCIKLRHQNQ